MKGPILKECLENAVLISKEQPSLTAYECWKLAIQLQGVIETNRLNETVSKDFTKPFGKAVFCGNCDREVMVLDKKF